MGKPFLGGKYKGELILYDDESHYFDECVILWSNAWPVSSPTNQAAIVAYSIEFFKKYLESWLKLSWVVFDRYIDLVQSVLRHA